MCEDVPGVQAGIHLHDGHAGFRVAVENRPLNGRGAAMPGEKRRVDVQAAKAREFEDGGRENLAVSGDDDEVGLKLPQLLDKRRLASPRRLQHGNGRCQRDGLDGRRLHFEVAALRFVGLGNDDDELKTRFAAERLKAGASQLGGSHENGFERRHRIAAIASIKISASIAPPLPSKGRGPG